MSEGVFSRTDWQPKESTGRQKRPVERGHVKTHSTLSDIFRGGQKSSKSVKFMIDTFRHFSRGTSFLAPFGGLWKETQRRVARQLFVRPRELLEFVRYTAELLSGLAAAAKDGQVEALQQPRSLLTSCPAAYNVLGRFDIGEHWVDGVGWGGGQAVSNQILTGFHGIRLKSSRNPFKSCVFRGTRHTPTWTKK